MAKVNTNTIGFLHDFIEAATTYKIKAQQSQKYAEEPFFGNSKANIFFQTLQNRLIKLHNLAIINSLRKFELSDTKSQTIIKSIKHITPIPIFKNIVSLASHVLKEKRKNRYHILSTNYFNTPLVKIINEQLASVSFLITESLQEQIHLIPTSQISKFSLHCASCVKNKFQQMIIDSSWLNNSILAQLNQQLSVEARVETASQLKIYFTAMHVYLYAFTTPVKNQYTIAVVKLADKTTLKISGNIFSKPALHFKIPFTDPKLLLKFTNFRSREKKYKHLNIFSIYMPNMLNQLNNDEVDKGYSLNHQTLNKIYIMSRNISSTVPKNFNHAIKKYVELHQKVLSENHKLILIMDKYKNSLTTTIIKGMQHELKEHTATLNPSKVVANVIDHLIELRQQPLNTLRQTVFVNQITTRLTLKKAYLTSIREKINHYTDLLSLIDFIDKINDKVAAYNQAYTLLTTKIERNSKQHVENIIHLIYHLKKIKRLNTKQIIEDIYKKRKNPYALAEATLVLKRQLQDIDDKTQELDTYRIEYLACQAKAHATHKNLIKTQLLLGITNIIRLLPSSIHLKENRTLIADKLLSLEPNIIKNEEKIQPPLQKSASCNLFSKPLYRMSGKGSSKYHWQHKNSLFSPDSESLQNVFCQNQHDISKVVVNKTLDSDIEDLKQKSEFIHKKLTQLRHKKIKGLIHIYVDILEGKVLGTVALSNHKNMPSSPATLQRFFKFLSHCLPENDFKLSLKLDLNQADQRDTYINDLVASNHNEIYAINYWQKAIHNIINKYPARTIKQLRKAVQLGQLSIAAAHELLKIVKGQTQNKLSHREHKEIVNLEAFMGHVVSPNHQQSLSQPDQNL